MSLRMPLKLVITFLKNEKENYEDIESKKLNGEEVSVETSSKEREEIPEEAKKDSQAMIKKTPKKIKVKKKVMMLTKNLKLEMTMYLQMSQAI